MFAGNLGGRSNFFSGPKFLSRNPNPCVLVQISSGGVGVFVKGGGPKSSVCPLSAVKAVEHHFTCHVGSSQERRQLQRVLRIIVSSSSVARAKMQRQFKSRKSGSDLSSCQFHVLVTVISHVDKNKHFGRISRDFWRDIPGVPEMF